jgi:streptogramin lyase
LKSFSRLFIYSLLVAAIVLAACDETTDVLPPEPPPQISVTKHFTRNSNPADTLTGLQSNDAYDVIVDSDGKTWICTQAGVSRYVGTSGDGVFNQTNKLPNPKCRALFEHNGTVWIGTWGGGVGTYDMADDTWSKLNSDSGLVNNMVGSIAEGVIHCSATTKISRLSLFSAS